MEQIKEVFWGRLSVNYKLGENLWLEIRDIGTGQMVKMTEDEFNAIAIDLKNLRRWLIDRPAVDRK
ncbi:MAG: hypothetical protein J6T10_07265 [Methanobrevibacter sp.]|nr:hypothetical protein [Methanobrevibacter sp.]